MPEPNLPSAPVPQQGPTFLSLMSTHHRLDALFLDHQEALIRLDAPAARRCLLDYESILLVHMKEEEEVLLPVFARAGRIEGAPPEFFLGEHKHMRNFLSRFKKDLDALERSGPLAPRAIIPLLDEQAQYKHLVEHHDRREMNLLYPALDRVTTAAERIDLLARCATAGHRP